jgi:hypothetical protein
MHINIWTPFTPSILIKYFSPVEIQLHGQCAYGCKNLIVFLLNKKKSQILKEKSSEKNLDLLFENLVELEQGQTRVLHDHLRTFLDLPLWKQWSELEILVCSSSSGDTEH